MKSPLMGEWDGVSSISTSWGGCEPPVTGAPGSVAVVRDGGGALVVVVVAAAVVVMAVTLMWSGELGF